MVVYDSALFSFLFTSSLLINENFLKLILMIKAMILIKSQSIEFPKIFFWIPNGSLI